MGSKRPVFAAPLAAAAGVLLAGLFLPASAQDIICCKQLVRFGGDWFGALRQCKESLEKATPEQRRAVCQQLKGSLCEDVAPYCQPCKGDEAKKKKGPGGNSLGPGDPIYDGMVDGARAAGITGFGPEHIGVQDLREKDGILKWVVRLDAQGCPLPTGDCVLWAGENGYLPEGKQEGAKEMIFGAIQFAGNSVRVNGRYVNVETGVISKSAKATTTGTGREAVARAMADMLRQLGLRCQQARGLNF